MQDTLTPLSSSLPSYLAGQMNTDQFVTLWRQAALDHSPTLPARYLQVLEHLLSQLESAALFSEESCSFSRTDMVASLGEWLSNARAL
jgi:aspartokinase